MEEVVASEILEGTDGYRVIVPGPPMDIQIQPRRHKRSNGRTVPRTLKVEAVRHNPQSIILLGPPDKNTVIVVGLFVSWIPPQLRTEPRRPSV